LHKGNVLFDAEYNITGVIDWTKARVVPVEVFTDVFDILPHPNFDVEDVEHAREFREMFVEEYRRLEETGRGLKIRHLWETDLPSAVMAWADGENRDHITNMYDPAEHMLRLVFGDDADMDNWCRRGRRPVIEPQRRRRAESWQRRWTSGRA
jgi:hypothetical protein